MTASQSPWQIAPHWKMLFAVLIVLIMTPLDASAVNVVLPILQKEFHIGLSQVAWVSLIYLLVLASLILPFGRLGDQFGFRRVYLLGAILFTISSALCGLTPTFTLLLVARVLQGIGACMLMALSSGITTSIFPPHERGKALGIVGMAVAIGLVVGPSLGGWLTHLGGWRWIFFINIPLGIVGSVQCYRLLPAMRPQQAQRVDWWGSSLAMVSLGSFVLTVTQGPVWRWTSPIIIALGMCCLLSGMLFIRIERHSPAPMLDLSLFRHPVFAGANIALVMNYLGQFCATFLMPKLLQDAMHLPVGVTGMVMMALPAAVFVLAPISGVLSDRVGTRALTAFGETLVTLGLVFLALVAAHPHLPGIMIGLALIGLGTGLFQAPNSSAIMGSVPRAHLGVGGGVLATMRNIGMTLGITVSSMVAMTGMRRFLAHHPGAEMPALLHGIQLAFFAGAAFAAIGAITSLLRADHS